MAYKHGIYTEKVTNAGSLSIRAQGTIPVYIGTAPVPEGSDVKLKPILINSFSEAKRLIGYSENWLQYSLCEAVYAHFMNTIRPIAPIVVIVVDELAGDIEDAFKALDKVEQICGVVPNILCVPSSEGYYNEGVLSAIEEYCTTGIAKKWGLVAYIDIALSTITEAINFQTNEGTKITDKNIRLHFPHVMYNGKKYHLSVLDCVASQWVDTESDGVSCRSTSNVAIDCDRPATADERDLYFDEEEANSLNAVGITTVNYIGGEYRIWGGHMANYRYADADNIEPQDKSDATVRADIFLHNWLKRNFLDNIDFPVSRRDIDGIVSNVNIGLNSFVKNGYLLKGECYFSADNNLTGDIAEGDITLDVQYTSTPNGKSITFSVQYTTEGLENIIAGEQEA